MTVALAQMVLGHTPWRCVVDLLAVLLLLRDPSLRQPPPRRWY
jgi:hypothetical protein